MRKLIEAASRPINLIINLCRQGVMVEMGEMDVLYPKYSATVNLCAGPETIESDFAVPEALLLSFSTLLRYKPIWGVSYYLCSG
jgi:hypothetical protein